MSFIRLRFKNSDPLTYEVDGPCKVELATTTTGLVSLGFHPESLIAVEFIDEATVDGPVVNHPPEDPEPKQEKPAAKTASKPAAKKSTSTAKK